MKTTSNRKPLTHKVAKATIQKLVNTEIYEWPPITFCGMYQPHRPEKPLPPQPQDKK